MSIENLELNSNRELDVRQRLALSVQRLAELREETEIAGRYGTVGGGSQGSIDAETVIFRNIPVVNYIVDGDLKFAAPGNLNKDGSIFLERVSTLPIEIVEDTQSRINTLLGTALKMQYPSAVRVRSYLPVSLPETRNGYNSLLYTARKYSEVIPLSDVDGVGDIPVLVRILDDLDSRVKVSAGEDINIAQSLIGQARDRARLKLPELLEEDSDRIRGLRSMVAEQKLSRLRREVAQTDDGKDYSTYELLINGIIEKEKLSEQTNDAQRKREVTLEKAREEVFANLARKRAIQKIVLLLDEDLLFSEALAKRGRMTLEELLTSDESIKRHAVNNALNSKVIVLSEEQRRVFNGSRILADESKQLEEEFQDPLIFISKLTDEEIVIIRNKIPRISDRRSVFYLAKDLLKQQTEDEITSEELLEALTQQTVRELLASRCAMAVDLAIRDLSINSDSLLINPTAVLQSIDMIVANALQYLRFDSPPLRLSNVEIDGFNENNSAQVLEMEQLKCLTEGNVVDLLEKMSQSPDIYGVKINEREGVKKYMVDQKAREILVRVSRFLADLTEISDKIILPETENEMSCLLIMVVDAITTGQPITLVTPICPDWSRNEEGQYDFKSLGGGESYIGKKFLTYGKEMLAVFVKYHIPFEGVLQFADWGLETEINAKDTYGRKLSPEDIQMCFQSTVAATDEHLRSLQLDEEVGSLFVNYSIVSMRESLESKLDIPKVQSQLEKFLTSDIRGRRLLNTLVEQSYKVNQARLGLNREENRKFALQNLIEYATEGQSIGPHSILVVCESRTTSRVYNLPRQKNENIPVFFVKGKEGVDKGVNIL